MEGFLLLESFYYGRRSLWMVFFGMLENTLWQGINSSFYPIPLTGWRSLSLSAKWLSLSSLSSLLSSHPPHQGMSQRIWHLGGERRGKGGEQWREKGDKLREELGGGGGEDSSRRVDRYLAETWEDASWALLPRWTLNESKRRWRGSPGSHVLYSILYSTAPNRSVYSITARALGYYLLHNSIMRVEAETTYYISSSTNPAQTQK